MKKLLIAGLLVVLSASAYSQIGIGIGSGGMGMGMSIPLNKKNGPQASRNLENQVQRMKNDLDLDKDQTQKVRSLLVERERRKDNGANRMMAKEFNERLEKILTSDQLTKLKEKRAQKQQPKQQEDKIEDKPRNTDEYPDDVYQ